MKNIEKTVYSCFLANINEMALLTTSFKKGIEFQFLESCLDWMEEIFLKKLGFSALLCHFYF